MASIQSGQYEKVIGKALFVKETMTAPLSGRTCVFYHVQVTQKRGKSWDTIIDDKKIAPFFLDCNGEMILIKADGPPKSQVVILDQDHKASSGFMNDASMRLENYLKAFGKQSTSLFGLNKAIKYYEGIIEPNEKIVVKGVAQWKQLNEPIEGYAYSKILTLSGSDTQKLYITDLKKALLE
ncbi:MAG: hypothetical protein KDC91_07845 [Flavobacteriaceae bacterium]|nr:hypothetical protein [Flavobacteriaceae bacterium]